MLKSQVCSGGWGEFIEERGEKKKKARTSGSPGLLNSAFMDFKRGAEPGLQRSKWNEARVPFPPGAVNSRADLLYSCKHR